MVEAAGQLFHLFRDGLDYAFIPNRFRDPGCGACYQSRSFPTPILGPAPALARLSQSMSLYTARPVGLVSPLGVAMPLSWRRVHRMSPVITSLSRAKAT